MNGLCSRGHPLAGVARRHGAESRRCLVCHRDRQRRYNARHAVPQPSPLARFWAKVDRSGECWLWRGATGGRAGLVYGRTRWLGRVAQAHRIAYEMLRAPIPAGLEIDHLCRTPLCVRPAHLEPVTPSENTRRMWITRKRAGQLRAKELVA